MVEKGRWEDAMPDARDRDRFILMAEDDEEDRMLVR